MAITLDGSTGVTAPALTGSIDASNLTGSLPAIDGSALTGIASGGMTLLGTIPTPSGSAVTLSGLTLTDYKLLYYVVDGVGVTTSTDDLCIQTANTDFAIGRSSGNPFVMYLDGFVDLNAGVSTSSATNNFNGSNLWERTTYRAGGRPSGYTTASTSITFFARSSTFFAGSIYVYGVA
jgi:hypothetical protein